MRRFLMGLILLGSLSMAFADEAAAGRVIKVLPLFLDLKGHDALSPSLYDRDAYQVYLRQHPINGRPFVSMFYGKRQTPAMRS